MVVGIVVHHPIGVSVPIPQAQPRGPRSAEALPESKRHDSVAAELHLQRRERRVHEDARIPNIRVLVGVRHGVSNALPGLDDLLVVLRVSLVVLVPEALRQLHPQALERRKVASQLDLETHVVPRERRAVGSRRLLHERHAPHVILVPQEALALVHSPLGFVQPALRQHRPRIRRVSGARQLLALVCQALEDLAFRAGQDVLARDLHLRILGLVEV
mmetsp:Transcript_9935/g.37480  ORF Transcript_9935/g.37480 Transcript_9935/m.37480 type:complete len:216 (-) Transcript_9935:53-700(-)